MDVIAGFQKPASAQPAPNGLRSCRGFPSCKGAGKGGESDGQAFLSLFIFPVCGRHRVIPSPLSFLDSDETEQMATAPSGQWSQRISCRSELGLLSLERCNTGRPQQILTRVKQSGDRCWCHGTGFLVPATWGTGWEVPARPSVRAHGAG